MLLFSPGITTMSWWLLLSGMDSQLIPSRRWLPCDGKQIRASHSGELQPQR
jgi:hypothetical protein